MHPRGLPPAPSIHGFCTQLLGGSYTKNQTIIPQINTLQGHPGGPVAKTVLPMQGPRVRSLVQELDPTGHYKDFTGCN